MSIQIQPEENFLHLIVEEFEPSDQDLSFQAMDEESWVILESMDDSVDTKGRDFVQELAEKCAGKGGLLVLTGKVSAGMQAFENLVWIPSYDEAVDYVFIEQLERELGNE